MKKMFSILLAVAMMATVSLTAFAEGEITSATGSDSADVNGKYVAVDRIDVYSVDVAWDGMSFVYTQAEEEWNTLTHQWETKTAGGWAVAEGSGADITLANHSSVPLNATFAFSVGETGSGATGSFMYNDAALVGALTMVQPDTTNVDMEYVVTFVPGGTLANTFTTSQKIGTITITLSAVTNE